MSHHPAQIPSQPQAQAADDRARAHGEMPRALLLHDGELADVRVLLEELGVRVWEDEGLEGEVPWDLVVFSPQRVGALRRTAEVGTRVAVLRRDARTLRALLRREGVHFVVRRPVHPAALRLLLLRALYRGPERRRQRRVPVGAPVRVRVGVRRHGAVLAELSTGGCRLLGPRRLRRGQRVTVALGAPVTGGPGLRLRGEVVRAGPARASDAGLWDAVVRFRSPSPRAASRLETRLEAVVERHASEPAVLPGPGDAAPLTGERRRQPRRPFPRRVIALGDEAARVLIGRDLSLGGMRVEAGAGLRPGQQLRLALHDGGRAFPLVVSARVVRDDGERGCVLRFHRLDEAARRYLDGMLRALPALAEPAPGPASGEIVVSELLEAGSG